MKKFLLSLLLFVCSLNITFGASGDNEKQFNLGKGGLLTKNSQYTYEFIDFPPYNGSVEVTYWDRNYLLTNNTDYLYSCVFVVDSQSWGIYSSFDPLLLIDGIEPGQLFCTSGSNIFIRNGSNSILTFYYIFTDSIPTSDIYSCSYDLAICESDLLTCQNDSSNCTTGYSDLFINEIQHPSAPLINITIPEEFDWTYTGNDEEYDVVVNGYNVDTEYIDGIIRNQTTLPDKTDFNKAISELVPLLVPGLVIILFLYFVFKSIKKIF